jgi:hypothetical protein
MSLSDNSGQHGAPVIYEDNPTDQTMVGRGRAHRPFSVPSSPDVNVLTPGALHRANSGYLLLDVQRLLAGNFGSIGSDRWSRLRTRRTAAKASIWMTLLGISHTTKISSPLPRRFNPCSAIVSMTSLPSAARRQNGTMTRRFVSPISLRTCAGAWHSSANPAA